MATRSTRGLLRRYVGRLNLTRAAALAAAALLAGSRHAALADTESTWVGGSGNWTNPNKWSDNDPFFNGYPNNGNGGRTFSAVLNSGTATLDAPITINAMTFGGGILTGTNTLTLGQQSTWTAGKLGGGVTVVANDGMTLSGGALKRLRANLTLFGNSDWSGGGDLELGLVYIGDDENGHSQLTNNGTFTINTDSDMAGAFASEALVVNNGTMIKQSGAGVTEIDATFMNNGTVAVNAGTLRFYFSGTHSGRFTGPGVLQFSRGHAFNPGASVAGNTVVFDLGGFSTVNTPNFSAATLNIAGGNVQFKRSPP
jgi:hypothetical protein